MNKYPRIDSVEVYTNKCLLVTFHNEVQKLYDCKPLLVLEPFDSLRDEVLFKTVKVDSGGYGVSWNDEIDLSESELWLHGKPLHASFSLNQRMNQNHEGQIMQAIPSIR